MTATLETPASEASTTTVAKMELFSVSMPWNANNSEEGNFSSWIWAETEDEAIRLLIDEMADSTAVPHASEDDRLEFINTMLENSDAAEASRVADQLLPGIEQLIGGPLAASDEAKADLAAVRAILGKYGVV